MGRGGFPVDFRGDRDRESFELYDPFSIRARASIILLIRVRANIISDSKIKSVSTNPGKGQDQHKSVA